MLILKRLLTLILFCFTINVSFAQINTDRPTQSASAFVVPKGRFQVETGFQYTRITDVVYQITYHNTLLRYGLNDLFELRLSTSNEFLDPALDGRNRTFSGFGPTILGFKSHISEENGFWPQISFLGQVQLPSGQNEFEVETAVPAFRFNFQHTINDNSSIGYNWGMEWSDLNSEATNIYTFIYSVSFARAFTTFFEFYGAIEDGSNDHRFDTGLIYLFSDNFQVDISGGPGLTEEAPDWFLGFGFSYYPK
ncbi:MAG: transporter [Cytophagales bacterium]|nr:transporter [Cytophagales bacterium]